jgi:hypothetical protein
MECLAVGLIVVAVFGLYGAYVWARISTDNRPRKPWRGGPHGRD